MADAMSMESNRTKTDISEERIESVMKEFDISREDAIHLITSTDRIEEAEKGDRAIIEQSKASGGYVKKYAYGGRVAKSSAEKS